MRKRFFSRVDSNKTRNHSLGAKKMRVGMTLMQGSFTQRVGNGWNNLPRAVVVVETVEGFKLEMDRFLEALRMEKKPNIGGYTWAWAGWPPPASDFLVLNLYIIHIHFES